MQKTKKVLVLTDNMPWGHRSVARSIYGMLKEEKGDFEVEYVEHAISMDWWDAFYGSVYRIPNIGDILYYISNLKISKKILENKIKQGDAKLTKLILSKKPDVVISAVNWYSQLVNRIENRKFKLVTLVTDPWRTYNISFVKGADWHFVYDEKMKQIATANGIPKDKIVATGWFVREEMYKKFKVKKSGKPVIFVGGGSLGTNAIPKILLAILGIKKPVKIIMNCGKDKWMYSLVGLTKKILKLRGKDKMIEIENHGWIENIAEVLAKTDIVFGKAGPNFLFDCVAQEKPFVAITHVGHEVANLDLIREKKLGWVKENYGEIKEFLNVFLDNPEKYKKIFAKTIKEEAGRNKKTMGKIAQIL